MESVINWVLSNINQFGVPNEIQVCEPYSSELISRGIVESNKINPPEAGREHRIVFIDAQNIKWMATLTV